MFGMDVQNYVNYVSYILSKLYNTVDILEVMCVHMCLVSRPSSGALVGPLRWV